MAVRGARSNRALLARQYSTATLDARGAPPDHGAVRRGAEERILAKFAYYRNLTARQRRIYDQSEAAGVVRVPAAGDLVPRVVEIAARLRRDDRAGTEAAAQRLVDGLLRRLHVPAVRVRVLAVRPSNHREELHGLYEFGGKHKVPLVSVWMRTAQQRRVVAFRTFLRTLLHEVVHHLDYQMLRLGDSYHTQGFYKRAEGLYRQLVPAELAAAAGPDSPAPAVAGSLPRATPVAASGAEDPGRRRKRAAGVEQPLLPFLT